MIFTRNITRVIVYLALLAPCLSLGLSLSLSSGLSSGLSSVATVSAKTRCRNTRQGQVCLSEVDFDSFAENTYQSQKASQWCWAACISMVFRYYGHPVSQERIVRAVYGRTVNLPSGPGWNIANQINRDWVDDNGERFSSRLTAVFDARAGIAAIDNDWIIDQLDQDHPIIIGTAGHAVVGTAMEHTPTPNGPYITRIGVFDPWPGRGARWLTPREMVDEGRGGTVSFIATVRVE